MSLTKSSVVMLAVVGLILAVPAMAAGPTNLLAEIQLSPTSMMVQPLTAHDGFKVSVGGPTGKVMEAYYAAGSASFDFAGLSDGQYTYEVSFVPVISAETRTAMAAARAAGDDGAIQALRDSGKLPSAPKVQYGYFRLQGGSPVSDIDEATYSGGGAMESMTGEAIGNITAMDQVILDDLIVDGSACIGFDCVNGESFGFDTLRLKENNLRIRFVDTSSSASFPSRDWQITANDSSNGGANKFSIDDIDGGRTPFTVEAGAPSHSLYVDDGGRLGLGTSTPVVDVHVKSGNTPTLRLEQDGTSGFTPQTWDVAGNEAGFFVRDATNGSTLPFRIIPSAASNSLVVDGDDQVGIGVLNPDASLQILDSGAGVHIEETQTTTSNRTMMTFENAGPITVSYIDSTDDTWGLNALSGGFAISLSGSGHNEMQVLDNGNVEAFGNFMGGVLLPSSRKLKTGFAAVDPKDVLAKVQGLELTTWHYDRGRHTDDALHLGPIAEDFWAAFGLGEGKTTLSPIDTNGVALAAIQGLAQELEEKDKVIAELMKRLEALEEAIQ